MKTNVDKTKLLLSEHIYMRVNILTIIIIFLLVFISSIPIVSISCIPKTGIIIILPILTFISLVKLFAIIQTLVWFYRHGENFNKDFKTYRREIHQNKELTNYQKIENYCSIFEENNGNFFPFGVKDYTLIKGRKRIRLFLRRYFFRYSRFILIINLYLFFISDLIYFDDITNKSYESFFILLLVVTILLSNIALSIESIFCYTFLNTYAIDYDISSTARSNTFLIEIKLFAKKLVAFLLSSTVACYITEIYFKGSFKGISSIPDNLDYRSIFDYKIILDLLFDCFYFTTTTFFTVGYGDIHPVNQVGKLISLLIMIQGFTFIVIVFASLMSSKTE